MLQKLHVYDLDGVLVDTSHRYRNKPDGTIDLEYWFANRTPEKIAQDKLLPMSEQYKADLADPATYVVICTSRAYTPHDAAFIRDRLGMPDKLIMRDYGDMTADGIYKRRKLAPLFNLRQFAKLPRFFWDDNRKIIDACRDLFTRTFLVPSTICETD